MLPATCDLSEKEARFIKAMWRKTTYRYMYNNLDTLELRIGDCIHWKYVLLLKFHVLKLKILLLFSSHTVYMYKEMPCILKCQVHCANCVKPSQDRNTVPWLTNECFIGHQGGEENAWYQYVWPCATKDTHQDSSSRHDKI